MFNQNLTGSQQLHGGAVVWLMRFESLCHIDIEVQRQELASVEALATSVSLIETVADALVDHAEQVRLRVQEYLTTRGIESHSWDR